LKEEELPMIRRVLPLALMAIACAGFVRGQGTTEKIEIVKYPVPGSPDAAGEIKTAEQRKVLDDFYQSKVLEELDHAAVTNSGSAHANLLADQVVWVSERLGVGERLTKDQVEADTGNSHLKMNTHTHDHVRMVAFGNTVVVSGRSTSVLHYGGKIDKGPRVFAEVWQKQPNGQWLMIEHVQADAPEGTTRGLEPTATDATHPE
jgi:hypothetical protein